MHDDETAFKSGHSASVTVGEDLSNLSQDELENRISSLQQEIERTRSALDERKKTQISAENFFKN